MDASEPVTAVSNDSDGQHPWAERLTTPTTVKGAIAIAAGLVVVVLPELSLGVAEFGFGVALVLAGCYDIAFAVLGPRLHRTGSRPLALVRGVLGLLTGLFVLLAERDALNLLLIVAGVYLLFRGLISLGAAVFTRDRARRSLRLVTGAASVAIGLLAVVVPEGLTEGIVLSVAVGSILFGAVLVTYGLSPATRDEPTTGSSAVAVMWEWLRRQDIGAQRRESLADGIYFEPPDRLAKLAAWWVMLLLSVAIATLAILQDSTAVVIGAMLIAPLMTPILGLAGALVNGWRTRTWLSARMVLLGVAVAIGVAYVIAAWVPALVPFDSNGQITSRVDPTFIDMLIALAAGAAGAFATVNARVASSIAGVAIAVALVPPLGVVGVSLQAGRPEDAFGAFLLFLTNVISIILAAAAVFVASGFASEDVIRHRRRELLSTFAPFAALALVILVPLVFTAEGILADATRQSTAQTAVEDWLGDDTTLDVVNVSVDGLQVSIDLAGSDAPPSPKLLQSTLTDDFGLPVTLVVNLTPTRTAVVSDDGTVQRPGD
jgi:uncharacterized hydrophobic protein (TIGR00271 family)